MQKVFHGGALDAAITEFGGNHEEWLDLSTGINPNPYPIPDIPLDAWTRLPGEGAEEKLLQAARQYYKVPDGFEIVAAPGTQALIQLLPRVLQAEEVAIVSPTYGEHAHAWKKAGVRVSEVSELDNVDGFTSCAVIVNPNNPDGRERAIAELQRMSEQLDCLIVDEAFCDANPEMSLVNEMPRNAIILKSFGKFFGLAGVRLGFVICKSHWANQFHEMLGPWAVSGAALEIGAIALSDRNWIEENLEYLFTQSSLQQTYLCEISDQVDPDLEVVGYSSLFTYIRHPRADFLYRYLAQNRILVRPFPERPEFLRLGLCKSDVELERLVSTLTSFKDA